MGQWWKDHDICYQEEVLVSRQVHHFPILLPVIIWIACNSAL